MKLFFGVATLLLAATSTHAENFDCERHLRMHGMLTRAQFECGFSHYNREIIDRAAECNRNMTLPRRLRKI